MKQLLSLAFALGFLTLTCACNQITEATRTPSAHVDRTQIPASEVAVRTATQPRSTVVQVSPISTPPIGTTDGRIAFVDEHDDIVVINPDGSGRKTLSHTTWGEHSPRWSPDGCQIAFVSKRDGNPEVYVMNADGTDQKRLTANPGKDLYTQWSPDGQTIAFLSDREGKWKVYLMASDGSSQRRLTAGDSEELWPTWSPNGKKVAFAARQDNSNAWEIQVVNADGSNKRVLTDNWLDVEDLTWSPDGRWIAFTADVGNNVYRLKIISSDGASIREIRTDSWVDMHPSWSPKPGKIAFISMFHEKDGQHLIVADIESMAWTDLTDDIHAWGFSWSPDGERLAYTRGAQGGIWIINSNGSGQPVFLVDGRDPQWSP